MRTATASTTTWPTGAAPPPPLGGAAGRKAGQGDRIGMLLDLDQGSTTVRKNDEGWG